MMRIKYIFKLIKIFIISWSYIKLFIIENCLNINKIKNFNNVYLDFLQNILFFGNEKILEDNILNL